MTARKTLRNASLLIGFEIANPLLSLLLIGAMSRQLGPEGLGAYNLLLNFFFVAHSFTSLGLNSLITREVSRDRESTGRYLCTSAVLGLLVAIVTGLGLVGTIRLLGFGGELERGGLLIAATLLPSIVILYSESIFIAHEKVQYIVYLALLENVGKVVAGLWLLRHGFGVMALIASFALFRYLTLALNLRIFHHQISPLVWRIDPGIARELLRNVPVFGTIFVAASLYSRADVFLLAKWGTLAAVGYYTAAYRLYAISQIVPKSVNTAIYPIFAKLFKSSPSALQQANSVAIRYLLVVMVPVSAGVSSLAGPVITMLFGAGFHAAVPVLRIVIWSLVPYGVVRVLASRLFASDRQVVDLKVNLIGLVTNVLLNLALIPAYGEVGCAWATLVSVVVFLGCQAFYLRREIGSIIREAEVHRPLLAGAGLLAWLWISGGLLLGFRIGGGAIVYIGLLFLLGAVRTGELRLVLPYRLMVLLPGEHEL